MGLQGRPMQKNLLSTPASPISMLRGYSGSPHSRLEAHMEQVPHSFHMGQIRVSDFQWHA